MNSTSTVCLPWYRREDYDLVRAMLADGNTLPVTFEHWERIIEKKRKKLVAEGHVVLKAYINPKTFPEWCRSRGHQVSTEAQMQFTTEFRRIAIDPKKSV